MIKVDGNKILVDTKTQTALFVDGRLTELVSKLDGQRYLEDTAQSPIYRYAMKYVGDRALNSFENSHK